MLYTSFQIWKRRILNGRLYKLLYPNEFEDDIEIVSLIGKVFGKYGIGTLSIELTINTWKS
jgi:hypothetical protein